MKHILFKNFTAKFSCALVLFILTIVIHSCKKDISQNQTQTVNSISIDQAKAWYLKTYPKVLSNKTLTSHSIPDTSGMPDFSQLIKPDWNKASSYIKFNNPVMELDLVDTTNLKTAIRNNPGTAWGDPKNSKTSFLIINKNGVYSAYIMMIVADTSYIKGDITKLSFNSYAKRDVNFSGTVTYFTPKGKLVNGWVYKNGKITGEITQVQSTLSAKIVNRIDKRPAYDENGCTYYFYEYYYTDSDGVDIIIDTEFAYSSGCNEQSLPQDNDGGGMGPPSGGEADPSSDEPTKVTDITIPINETNYVNEDAYIDDPNSATNGSLATQWRPIQYYYHITIYSGVETGTVQSVTLIPVYAQPVNESYYNIDGSIQTRNVTVINDWSPSYTASLHSVTASWFATAYIRYTYSPGGTFNRSTNCSHTQTLAF